MHQSLDELILRMAQLAGDRKHNLLSYLLRMAGAAALDVHDKSLEQQIEFSLQKKSLRFGVWDWDVANDKNYCDPVIAEMFGVNSRAASKGLKNEDYVRAIHPADLPGVSKALQKSVKTGGEFNARYRIVSRNKITWVLAKGRCFLNANKAPIRFPGTVIDLTDMAPAA
jgi:PAS domain-containing protein